MTRDGMCIALQNLYAYEPEQYHGMTLAEISQAITLEELEGVFKYWGIA